MDLVVFDYWLRYPLLQVMVQYLQCAGQPFGVRGHWSEDWGSGNKAVVVELDTYARCPTMSLGEVPAVV